MSKKLKTFKKKSAVVFFVFSALFLLFISADIKAAIDSNIKPNSPDSGTLPMRIVDITDSSMDICWPSLFVWGQSMDYKASSYKFSIYYSMDNINYSLKNITEGTFKELPVENGKVGYYCYKNENILSATTYYFKIHTIFNCNNHSIDSDFSSPISAKTIGNIPIISNGMLIRTACPDPNYSLTYLVENGLRRSFSSREIFEAKGFKFSDVVSINRNQMDALPLGSPISLSDNSVDIPEGAIIRAIGGIDVYIVKYVGTKKFKRLVLSPSVFNNYGHLKWEDVMVVDQSVVNSFTTSDLVRAVGDNNIYWLYAQGDTGGKRLIKSHSVFAKYELDTDGIYEINGFDKDSYITETDLE
jgi:hypothetical protein